MMVGWLVWGYLGKQAVVISECLVVSAFLASLVLTVLGVARGSWVALLAAAVCSFLISPWLGMKPLGLTYAQLGVAVGWRWRWHWLATCASAIVATGVYVGLLYGIPAVVRAIHHVPPPVVAYRHRRYFAPQSKPCQHEASLYGPLHGNGQKVIGLPVLMTPGDEASPTATPTVLILRQDRQTCLVYLLEGTP